MDAAEACAGKQLGLGTGVLRLKKQNASLLLVLSSLEDDIACKVGVHRGDPCSCGGRRGAKKQMLSIVLVRFL
jgi:hypothetical protein